MMKRLAYVISLLFVLTAVAQNRPYVNGIFPLTAKVNETVTISGSGFSTNAGEWSVFFGAVKGTVISATANVIEARVPAGATYDEVFLVNTSTGLSAASGQFFTLNYGGDTFDGQASDQIIQNFAAVQEVTTNQTQVYDLCLCDFDLDGLPDIAVTAFENGSANARRLIYKNNSTPASVSFQLALELRNQPSQNVNCKDLDGDGKPELVVSEVNDPSRDSGLEEIEIYLNTSTTGTISFADPIFVAPPFDSDGEIRNPVRLELEDIDYDGKPDIIMSNRTEENVDIYLNTSTIGSLSFNTSPSQISLPTGRNFQARGIKLGDLNQDNLVDLVVIPDGSAEVYVYENQSTVGDVSFRDPVNVTRTDNGLKNVEIADFDRDGFADIAVATDVSGGGANAFILRNTTSGIGERLSFNTSTTVATTGIGWGISVGDIDGDGDPDLAVTDVQSSSTTLSILNNESTNGNLAFRSSQLTTNANTRNIRIGDINGDSKPDILATAKSQISTIGSIFVIVNENCVTPQITTPADVYCPGVSFNVEANPGVGLTYNWSVNGNVQKSGADNFIDLAPFTGSLTITVETVPNKASCARTSTAVPFTENNVTPANPSFTAPASVCVDADLALSADLTADNYFWTGPNGFTSSDQSPTINSIGVTGGGTYSLVIQQNGGCKSQPFSQSVSVISTPFPTIGNEGPDNFCVGGETVLFANSYPGFNYQWNLNGSPIAGENSTSLNVSSSGNFSLTLIDQTNTSCTQTGSSIVIQEVDPPVPAIQSETEKCVDLPIDFIGSKVSGSDDFGLIYSWVFNDPAGQTVATDGNVENTMQSFSEAGVYTAALSLEYADISGCSSSATQNVTISDIPDFNIQAENFIKCPEDSILLSFEDNLVSYSWSNGDTSNTTFGQIPEGLDTLSIDIVAVNDVGCIIRDTVSIQNFTDGALVISSPEADVVNNEIIFPPEEISIQLEASGGTDYDWSPSEIFDDTTATVVNVNPQSTRTQIILTGTDQNGCFGETSIELVIPGVLARKSFSPNGDMLGFECWEILNTVRLAGLGCRVFIFDNRGRNVVDPVDIDTNGSDCIWDGKGLNGRDLPPGVYYFVLQCDDNEFDNSGSILLAR
jgi:hypothetical protein